jgi:hypothetical protein
VMSRCQRATSVSAVSGRRLTGLSSATALPARVTVICSP